MKKVAILTTFYEAHSGFSLIGVTETQVRMLLDHGHDPAVLVSEGFETTNQFWHPSMFDIRRCIPKMALTDRVAPNFEERVQAIHGALRENLGDADVCITHGVLALPMYKEHNVAFRRYAQERPDLLWLHWIHSAPEHPRSTLYPWSCRSVCPPGYIVYPNETDKGLVRKTFGLSDQPERIVHCRAGHAQDPLTRRPYSDLTKKLVRGAGLLDGDVSVIYPVRMDRNKRVEVLLWILAGVNNLGFEPRLLIVDWQSQGEKYLAYKRDLDAMVEDLGLEGKVHYSSRLDDRSSQGVPHDVVVELFDHTNVYFHPSGTETYSLVVHEAILGGNVVYANGDFPAMLELYGDAVYYLPYGSRRHNRTYQPDEPTFWMDQAARVVSDLRINKAVHGKTRARKEWTPQEQWRNFAPLLGMEPMPGYAHDSRDYWRQPPAGGDGDENRLLSSATLAPVELEAVPA